MKRAMLCGVALSILSSCFAVLAQETPATGQSQSQTRRAERAREQARNLSPEERAQLREKWANMSEEERTKARAQLREKLGGDRPGSETGQPKSAAEQIAALKQEHQATMNEFKAIRQLAAKEKATETGKALDALIARHEQTYQKRLQQMEQRLQRMQAAQKGGDQAAPKAGATDQAPANQRQRNATRQRQK